MLKKTVIALALLLPCMGYGQSPDKIIENTHGTVRVLNTLPGGQALFISPDSRYIGGTLGTSSGFIYDVTAHTSQKREDIAVQTIISPTLFSGQMEGAPAGFIMKDNIPLPLERTTDSENKEFYTISIYGSSADGGKLGAMAYDKHTFINSRGEEVTQHINYGAVFDGVTGKLQRWLKPLWPMLDPPYHDDNTGYGARVDAISADGTVAMGHSSHPGSFSNWTATIWDISSPDTTYTLALDPDRFCMGNFYSSTNNGNLIVGGDLEAAMGFIAHYDKTSRSIVEVDSIYPLPGFLVIEFIAISEDSTSFGYQQIADPGSRSAVVHNNTFGLITLTDYLYEFYDLNLKGLDLFTPMAASDDGKTITGFLPGSPSNIPWVIELNEPILPRARRVSAKASQNALQVAIKWAEPINSKNPLLGYNIYRDTNTKLNTELLSINTLSFVDDRLEAGTHTYSIEAVYSGDVNALKTTSNSVLALAAGSCYPVQNLDSRLEYNKFVTLYWGTPSSEIANSNGTKLSSATKTKSGISQSFGSELPSLNVENGAKTFENAGIENLSTMDMQMYTGYAGIQIGEFYYITSHQDVGIQVYDMFNNRLKVLTPTGLGNVYSMVYVNNKLYCGGPKNIYVVDLENPEELADIIPVPSARHLAYVPSLDENKGGFELGDFESSFFYSLDGDSLDKGFDFSKLAVTGTAYHNGKLYVASQTGKDLNEIYTYNFETKEVIGKPVQPNQDPALRNMLTNNGEWEAADDEAIAGGLSLNVLEDGTVALGEVMQCAYISCRLAFFEIESRPDLRGYNLFRNGFKINDEPLTSRRYNDVLDEAGTFVYTVKPITVENATSDDAPSDTVKIVSKGTCLPPMNIKAIETNGYAVVSWELNPNTSGLVGFNVYKDGEIYNKFWNKEVRLSFVDTSVSLGNHVYRIENFHEFSCVASDSVSIDITHNGVAMPPFALTLSYAENKTTPKKYDLKANWETPMFEQPLALRYGVGLPSVSLEFAEGGYTECWLAIGWDTTDMKLYKDLYIVGMEFYGANNLISLEGFTFTDNVIGNYKDAGRVKADQWQAIYFDNYVSMNQAKECGVGYHITFADGAKSILPVDLSFVKARFSDVISMDGIAFTSGGTKGSWCMAALAVHKRDLDAATKNGVVDKNMLTGKMVRVGSAPVSLSKGSTVKKAAPSTKEALTLKGFNVYRDDISNKLNKEVIKDFSYTDSLVGEGEYTYMVGAVYNNAEPMTELYIEIIPLANEDILNAASIALYPNPTAETVNISGEYKSLQVCNLTGKTVLKLNSPKSSISLNSFSPGTYIFNFTTKEGKTASYKVILK